MFVANVRRRGLGSPEPPPRLKTPHASRLHVEPATAARLADLRHHLLDQRVLAADLRHLRLKAPGDRRRESRRRRGLDVES
ncbi:MAG: hypothetical protein ACKOWG_19890, partial [Planctomycetia bacterium]